MTAILAIPLLIVVALVLDIGNAYQQKIQLQFAADSAALAAAQDLPAIDAAIETAKQLVFENAGLPTNGWAGCSDEEALAVTPEGPANTCISFDVDSTVVRVRIPTRTIDTAIAPVIGIDSLDVGASAVAASFGVPGQRILPATIASDMGTGLLCLENAGDNVDCANRSSGNFGSINSPRLTTLRPVGAKAFDELAINYAMNVDHDLDIWSATDIRTCDGKLVSPCSTNNDISGDRANHLVISTGNDIRPVTEGYVAGFEADIVDMGRQVFCGRLARPDFSATNILDPHPNDCTPGEPTTEVLGVTVNGRHIYYWLTPDARSKFYPEVVALGLADDDPRLVNTNNAYSAGDVRLQCYLAGYRFDSTTSIETVPNCFGASGSVRNWHDDFSTPGFSTNVGSEAFHPTWLFTTPNISGVSDASGALVWRIPANGRSSFAMGRRFDASAALAQPNDVTILFEYGTIDLVDPEASCEISLWNEATSEVTSLKRIDTSDPGGLAAVKLASSMFGASMLIRLDCDTPSPPREAVQQQIWVDNIDVSWSNTPTAPTLGPIFRAGVRQDPRFGIVPRILDWPAISDKGSPLAGYWASYTYNLYTTSQKLAGFDGWVLDPALIEGNVQGGSMAYGFSPEPRVSLIG